MDARRLAQLCGNDLAGPALDELARLLDAGVVAARARWPEIGAHEAELVEALAARVEGEADLVDGIARLALPDIYLVTAVLAGDRAALAAFERLVRDETTRAVARLGSKAPSAEDVVQELLVKVLVPVDGRPPKLAAFGGH